MTGRPPGSPPFPYPPPFRSRAAEPFLGGPPPWPPRLPRTFATSSSRPAAPPDPRDLLRVRPWQTLRDLARRSEEHTSELQSRQYLVCRLLLEKKKKIELYLI